MLFLYCLVILSSGRSSDPQVILSYQPDPLHKRPRSCLTEVLISASRASHCIMDELLRWESDTCYCRLQRCCGIFRLWRRWWDGECEGIQTGLLSAPLPSRKGALEKELMCLRMQLKHWRVNSPLRFVWMQHHWLNLTFKALPRWCFCIIPQL